MKPRISGLIGIVALLAGTALACHNDPTAEGVGSPFAVVLDFSSLTLDQGTSAQVVARIVDSRFTPLTGDITFASCNAATTVAPDPTFVPEPPTAKRATIAAVSANAGCVVASAAGAKPDSVAVVVLPTSLAATPSTANPQVGGTLTLTVSGALQFSASSNVNFGGSLGEVISQTATDLTVRVPVPDAAVAGPLDVTGVDVTYVPGLTVTLPTAASFTVTNPLDPNDAPDPAATLVIPASGDSLIVYEGFATGAADNFYTITLGATTTFSVTLGWNTAADLDILWCDAGCNNFVGNFDGAGSSNPEASTVTLPAGSYNLWINNFDDHGEPAHIYKITVRTP